MVVSDGWPQPPAATARFRLLAPHVGAVVHIPFVPALRLADTPAGVPLPRAARRALDQIRAATGRPLSTGQRTTRCCSNTLAVHGFAACHRQLLAAVVPNPAPSPRPAFPAGSAPLLAWWKWAALIAGVFGLIGCGAMIAIGRRNRSNLAADGATGIPWVLAGLTLIALSSGIVGVFM